MWIVIIVLILFILFNESTRYAFKNLLRALTSYLKEGVFYKIIDKISDKINKK